MPKANGTRISANSIRHRTESLHRASGALRDDFLQYLFGMALLHLDEQAQNSLVRGVKAPAVSDPQIVRAAKLVARANEDEAKSR